MTAPSPARREAIAMLVTAHGAPAGVVGAATGLLEATVERIAARAAGHAAAGSEVAAGQGDVPPFRDPAERVALLADRLIGEMEAIEIAAEGGGFDKARIDAVASLTRALEKLSEFTSSGPHRKEVAKRTDEQLADALARIDARIVELAHEYARELVADEPGWKPASPYRGGMD